jgi:hypothetical protein
MIIVADSTTVCARKLALMRVLCAIHCVCMPRLLIKVFEKFPASLTHRNQGGFNVFFIEEINFLARRSISQFKGVTGA